MLKKESRLNGILLGSWHPYLWIVLAIALVYFRTLSFGFTSLDDKELILDNFNFISNLSNVPQAFMTRVFPKLLAPYYRPLLIVSFMLNAKIGGTAPLAYHYVNILIHMLVCCMIFRLLVRLGSHRMPALFFTLCFSVHPALVQAVAWVPGRNDSMLAVFALASFLSFLRYLDTRKPAAYFMHMAFFVLALFTKETAIMIAAVVLLYVALIDRKTLSGRELRFFVWGWFLTAACWFIIRDAALKGSFESTAGSLTAAFLVSAPAFIQYIGKIIMPFNLSVFPVIRDTTFLYGIATILLFLFALRYSKPRRPALVLFGLCWFFLFLAPAFLRPSAKFVHDFQEHRMYLPLVGILIATGEIGFLKKMLPNAKTLAACALVICILAAINIRHGENFRNRLTFWENAAAASPSSWLTHLKVASIYYDEGSLDKAEQEYSKVIELDRVSSPAYAGLGHVYMAKNMPEKAEGQLKRAVAAYPANYPAYVSLGTLYYKQGKLKEAAAMWVEALKYEPKDTDALRNLAILCAEQKDNKAARFYVERLLEAGVRVPPDFLAKIEND